MRKFSVYAFCLLLIPGGVFAQNNEYFQQKVDHRIEAQLIDSIHVLEAEQWITYINRSPDALDKLYFHLWPNAYLNNKTAFAKQQIQLGKTEFYFSEESERGGYRSIDFFVEGEVVSHVPYNSNPDVVSLSLKEKLLPGDTLEIRTEFSLKIPITFSRLGRAEGSYQLTQWYPKPAVYDREGWHPMPYLDQGEFYSEFGDFEVEITLPEKYVVAATGTLQSEKEMEFLKKKANRIKDLQDVARLKRMQKDSVDQADSTNNNEEKTLRYTAENVHDFALFMDEDFEIQYERFELSNGDSVDAWSFFTPKQITLWLQSLQYLKRAVRFYSKEIGSYPYPQVTAVQGPLKAGAGMEYPMITVIGQATDERSLDNVITHEVGHNWWYGILASNERLYPWLDEGINSYFEERYMSKYYPPTSADLNDLTENRLTHEGRWVWEMQANQHRDQAPATPSDEFTEINYFLGAYWKPAQSLLHLTDWAGEEKMTEAYQSFYEEYKFRHFGPEDFISHMEAHMDDKLDWLFDGLINSNNGIDYGIQSIKKQGRDWLVTVRNRGEIEAPVSIGGFRYDSTFVADFSNGFSGKRRFRVDGGEDLEAIRLNVNEHLPEHQLSNNLRRVKNGKVKWKPVQLGFLVGLNNPYKRNLYLTPAIGYNAYDGFQIGLWAHNVSLPGENFEFSVLPNLGIASDQFAGMADARYRWFFNSPKGGISHISVGLGFRNYSYNQNESYGFFDRYLKVAPYFEIHGERDPLSFYQHYLRYRPVFIEQTYNRGIDIQEGTFETLSLNYWVHQLSYHISSSHPIFPFKGHSQIENVSGAWRYTLHYDQRFQYNEGRFLEFSIFAGGISNYEDSPADIRLLGTGQTGFGRFQSDYTFDRIMIGRNEQEGLWSRQIFDRDAFLKTRARNIFSYDFMIGFGLRGNIPIPNVPIVPYMDVVVFNSSLTNQTETAFSSGLAISLFRETLEVYFPVWESALIRDSYFYQNNEGYFNKITFKLNLQQWGVFSIKEQLNLL